MTPEERLNYCNVCSNRKFVLEKGTVCGLTSEKPTFDGCCDSFHEDPVAAEEERARKKKAEENIGINGFLAFFVYWAIPLGIVFTLISHLANWKATAAMGTFAVLFEISFLLFFLYFQIYTIYGFVKRKPDAVFIAKYQLIVILITNLFILLIGANDESSFLGNTPRLIISAIWCIGFYIYLLVSDDVEALIPRETRKLSKINKILVILSLVIPIVLYVGAIFESTEKTYGASAITNPEKQLKAVCKNLQSTLPDEISENLFLTNVSIKGNALVFDYEYSFDASQQFEDISDNYKKLASEYQKELSRYSLSQLTFDDDPIFGLCAKTGKEIRYVYSTSSGDEIYSYSLDKDEYSSLLSKDYKYKLTSDRFDVILGYFNAMMPIEYFEGAKLTGCTYSDEENSIHYDIELIDMDMSTLSGLTGSSIKEYMLELMPYLSDAPFVLSVMNNKTITYDFTADCSSLWNMTVKIKPEDYFDLFNE